MIYEKIPNNGSLPCFYSSSFAMAQNNVAKPSVENYKTKIMNIDQQIIQLIAERRGWRDKMLKLEKSKIYQVMIHLKINH